MKGLRLSLLDQKFLFVLHASERTFERIADNHCPLSLVTRAASQSHELKVRMARTGTLSSRHSNSVP